MSEMVLVTKSLLDDIADAIGSKLNESANYTLAAMPNKILSIKGGNKITVKGAPYSQLRYYPTDLSISPININLDNKGECELSLSGTYTFINMVTIDNITYTAINKTVTIDSETTEVKLYPEGYIYWFGLELESGFTIASGGSYTQIGGYEHLYPMTSQQNCISGESQTVYGSQGCVMWGSNQTFYIDKSKYTKLKGRVLITLSHSSYNENVWEFITNQTFSKSSSTPYHNLANFSSSTDADITLLEGEEWERLQSGNYYIGGWAGNTSNSTQTVAMKILALWLE